jgi:hypothetical protein
VLLGVVLLLLLIAVIFVGVAIYERAPDRRR